MSATRFKLFPVYWSRQHGAYLTLISSWIIAMIYSGVQQLQWVTIVLLLCGLNFTELISEKFTRRTKLPATKMNWLIVYGSMSVLLATLLLYYSVSFRILFPFLASGGALFVFLSKKRFQKKLIFELFTFLLFAIAGFIGSSIHEWKEVITVMLCMSVFFGSSVFMVKERFGKIETYPVLFYCLFASLSILLLLGLSIFSLIVMALIFVKTSIVWVSPERFHRLPIQKIGMLEFAFQLLFILNFLIYYK